jgi:hypothetical protein
MLGTSMQPNHVEGFVKRAVCTRHWAESTISPYPYSLILTLVYRDNNLEANETFFVDLSRPSSIALISNSRGIGTILNDDH